MPDVKTQLRAIAVFRVFAEARKPLRLSDLAIQLGIPISSCFAIVRGLLEDGYLYELSPRGGYYPTGRMQEHVAAIGAHDPILERIGAVLYRLRDETVETVTLGKRVGSQFIYVTGLESPSTVRLTVLAGSVRPLHANAMGKALLGSLSAEARHALLAKARLDRLTPQTIVSAAKLEKEIEKMARRDWYSSVSESTEGGAAVAMPLSLAQGSYAVQIAGPAERMKSKLAQHVRSLGRAREEMEGLLKAG